MNDDWKAVAVYDHFTRMYHYEYQYIGSLRPQKREYEFNPWTRTLMRSGPKGPKVNKKPGPKAKKLRGEKRRKPRL